MSEGAAPTPALTGRQRSPLVEMLIIAAPTIATMTSYTLMQFLDKLMVSRLADDPVLVGAQGNGGLASFVPIALMMGMITVINTYVSQNLGAGRPERAPAYAWAGVWMSVMFWAAVMLPFSVVLPGVFEMMRGAGLSEEMLAEVLRRDAMATGYGRILIMGSVITLAARAISQYFYGMHRPGIVLAATLTGNLVNLAGNSLLIYGPISPAATGNGVIDGWFAFTAGLCDDLGIPRLGMNGAAYATLIGTTVELAIPMGLFLSKKYRREFGTLAQWRPSPGHMKDLFKIGWPGALMFGNEMVCWAFFMVYLVGAFGPMHSTAGWIAHQWMTLSFMPTVGLSIAITATVGKCMGMKRPDLATQRAWMGLGLAVGYMTLCGVAFVVFRRQLVGLFIQEETSAADAALIIRLGSSFLIATAAFQFFDGIAMSLNGALRGAGDTRWTGIVTLVLSWTVIVAGGLVMVNHFPALESIGPWMAAAAYIIVLALAILGRFLGGRWKRIALLAEAEGKPEFEAGRNKGA